MRRRAPFSLPFAPQIPGLCAAIEGRPISQPDGLVDAALHHNLAGQVLGAASRGQLELPAAERERLMEATAVRLGHVMRLRHELPAVLSALAEACGRPPLLLKGPAVADRLYDEPALRPFADLDLLVPRDRLDAAMRGLEGIGYETMVEFRPGYAERFGHDRHAVRQVAGSRIEIEVHWRVGDDPVGSVLSHERLAARSEPLALEGTIAAVPDLPDQLLVLAVHLLSDRAKRLCWVNDIALLARALDDDAWAEVFARADELGLGWVLHRALDYADAHLEVGRARPTDAPAAPAWGPLRAVEELDARAAPHLGRLVMLRRRERARYLRAVLWPTAAGLRGTVGPDAAPAWRLALRHGRRALLSIARARR